MAAAKRKAPSRRKKASRRELIYTGTNKLFVRRNERGTSFKKVVDAGSRPTSGSTPSGKFLPVGVIVVTGRSEVVLADGQADVRAPTGAG